MRLSGCVIWPIFSLGVIWASSFTTAAAEAPAGGPAGVRFRRKNVGLSTIPEAASSAQDGRGTTVQTASKITICQGFLCGVDTGISLPSILPFEAGYSKFCASENRGCGLTEKSCLAICGENENVKWPMAAGILVMKQTSAVIGLGFVGRVHLETF